jgi:MFS family permease
MSFSPLMVFLGTDELPPLAQGLIQRFVLLISLQTSLYLISRTFYVLVIIDYVGFQTLGLFLAVSALLQAILDYPSGVLGDWIGQRWVLTSAFLFYGLSYGLLFQADSLLEIFFVYVFSAIASSQESGALQSWFDNNYKITVDRADSNRDVYQEFQGKYRSIIGFIGAFTIVLGGFIATLLFRKIVFMVQAVGMFFTAALCLFFVTDFSENIRPKRSFSKYFHILKEGIYFGFFTKYMFFLTISICLWNIIWQIWVEMMLFPIYFGYSGSDAGAGIIRFIGWIGHSIFAGKAGMWSKKLNTRKWVPRLNFIILFSFFGYFALLLTIFPLENKFNIIPVSLILCYFFVFLALNNIFLILRQRLIFDLVPNSIRNSIYSLFPTLTLLIGIPLFIASGSIIEYFGISFALTFLLIIGFLSSSSIYISFLYMPLSEI